MTLLRSKPAAGLFLFSGPIFRGEPKTPLQSKKQDIYHDNTFSLDKCNHAAQSYLDVGLDELGRLPIARLGFDTNAGHSRMAGHHEENAHICCRLF
jgi:hypothetical protein